MSNVYKNLTTRTIAEGSANNPRNSEASIIELKDGSLLIAWQTYEKSDHGCGDEAPATISIMNSYDNGETWVNRRVVAKMIPGCVNCYSPTLFRRLDGSLSLFFKRYTHLKWLEEALCSYYRIDSHDEGETWSEEHLLLDNQKLNPINDTLKRLADGSVLMPVECADGAWGGPGENSKIIVLRSEDDCETWTKSNVLSVPLRGMSEPCIAQRPDGSLNMVLRNQLGSVFYSESFDGGRTWSKPQTTGLRAPESCPASISIPNSDAQLVIWNNSEYDMHHGHYGKRTPLTMAISRDGFKTFTDFCDIETDPERAFTNPAITITSSGLCLVSYWTCKYFPDVRMGNGYIDLKLATFNINL